jgi:hypothetical protein
MSTASSFNAAPVKPPLPVMAHNDFAPWLPAMLVKELRQGLRTRGFVGVFIGFQIIMVMVMLTTVLGSVMATSASRAVASNSVNSLFWTLLMVQLCLIVPARALTSLQVELDSRSLDLLVLTRLTAWRIVLGKWISLMAQAALLLVAMLPYGIIRYFLGSVDLVEDASQCARLLGTCAVLTAAGLTSSGMPKLLRILVPIGVIIGLQTATSASSSGFRLFSTTPAVASMSSPSISDSFFFWLNGAIILTVLLVGAVRRIAPPADNHQVLTRAVSVFVLLLVPLWWLAGNTTAAREQLQFAGAFLFVIGAIELTSVRLPMAAHWRTWLRLGAAGRWLGRFTLPGWPSAFFFFALITVLAALCTQLPGVVPVGQPEKWVRLAWLGLTALVFPALVLSFFPRAKRSPTALYFAVFLALSVFAVFAKAVALSPISPAAGLLSFAEVLPVSSWWLISFSPASSTSNLLVVQAIIAGLVFIAAWWQSRPYWKRVAGIVSRLKVGK